MKQWRVVADSTHWCIASRNNALKHCKTKHEAWSNQHEATKHLIRAMKNSLKHASWNDALKQCKTKHDGLRSMKHVAIKTSTKHWSTSVNALNHCLTKWFIVALQNEAYVWSVKQRSTSLEQWSNNACLMKRCLALQNKAWCTKHEAMQCTMSLKCDASRDDAIWSIEACLAKRCIEACKTKHEAWSNQHEASSKEALRQACLSISLSLFSLSLCSL
jgi:hypothetical protein